MKNSVKDWCKLWQSNLEATNVIRNRELTEFSRLCICQDFLHSILVPRYCLQSKADQHSWHNFLAQDRVPWQLAYSSARHSLVLQDSKHNQEQISHKNSIRAWFWQVLAYVCFVYNFWDRPNPKKFASQYSWLLVLLRTLGTHAYCLACGNAQLLNIAYDGRIVLTEKRKCSWNESSKR